MQDRLSNEYISNAIDELVNTFGVKEEAPHNEMVALLLTGKTKECIMAVASHLGLPVEIHLSHVPKDYRPGATERFGGSHLARTDSEGRGVEAITAQVVVPENLPMYGTSSLVDFPIQVKVQENCDEQPDTFISVIAHELCHILLKSIWHPQRNNEVYTDLTSLLLGFCEVTWRGRKVVATTSSGNLTTTTTTTYGYLTDTQFAFARNKIEGIRDGYNQDKLRLLAQMDGVTRQSTRLKRSLFQFRKFMAYLDAHYNRAIRKQDGAQIVQFHSPGYADDIDADVEDSGGLLKEAQTFCESLDHYTGRSLEMMRRYEERLDLARDRLEREARLMNENVNVLKRNVGFLCRIRTANETKRQLD